MPSSFSLKSPYLKQNMNLGKFYSFIAILAFLTFFSLVLKNNFTRAKSWERDSTVDILQIFFQKKEKSQLIMQEKNKIFPKPNYFLSEKGAINRINTRQKIVALTFDADMTRGMEYSLKNGIVKSWYNDKLIKELEKTQTPATLFLTGLWIKNYPETTKELAANPLFEIANHSYSHPAFALPCFNLIAIPNTSDEEEIVRTDELLKSYAPNYKKYFRFPGLCYDEFDIAAVEKHGYKIIHGDVIGGDGFTNDAGGVVSRVVGRAKPGSIIILHMQGGPNAPKTADAIPEIIRQLKEKGYLFVKISDLMDSD